MAVHAGTYRAVAGALTDFRSADAGRESLTPAAPALRVA
jgi:hypothetical protein